MKKIIIFLALSVGLFILGRTVSAAGWLKWFPFDRKEALGEWKEKIFHGRVLYEVSPGDEKGYLRALSNKASSGLFYKISFNPRQYPYISWSWKVSRFPSRASGGVLTRKSWIERDDYALRVYVIFPAFIFTNTKCLEYVWAEDLPKGKVLASPFFKNIRLIVLESGSKDLGKWISEERNIVNDYKMAFNSPSPPGVGAIAIMSDSDNTQSSCEGYYADIKVGYREAILSYPQYTQARALKPKTRPVLKDYIRRLLFR